MKAVDTLLTQEGLTREAYLDETLGLFDESFSLAATGSIAGNTLRCIAVDGNRRGEGLLAEMVTALLHRQFERGHTHVFLYTKSAAAPFFASLGFSEIARTGSVVFMENRRNAFQRYLEDLSRERREGKTAAIVMNANPFTRGHRHLVERASGENDAVHCFVVSEDLSLVPFADRMALVKAGVADLPNVVVHPSGNYIVSSATFPSYFIQEAWQITEAQAGLDVQVFARIGSSLGIARRYIGEEPFSQVTGIYNQMMLRGLPPHGIECVLVPRLEESGVAISASGVRQLIHDGDLEAIRPHVPETTYAYFQTEAGQRAIQAIRAAENVRHA